MQQVFITGTNRGIGYALVERYLSSGDYHIFATCRQPDSASALNCLEENYPDKLSIVPLEVTEQDSH